MIEGAQTQEVESPPSLRDVVSDAYEEHSPDSPKEEFVKSDLNSKEARARDDAGRFAKERRERAEREGKAEPKAPVQTEPAYTAPKRPQSWKADLDEHWGKLPKQIHDEILRRESDYAKGVSTYKAEYDRLRPLGDALKPHEDILKQSGLTPDKFINALASTHRTLSTGDKESKLKAFARFAQDYGIPLHEMFTLGEDGKLYQNQTYFQPTQPQQPQGLTPEQVRQEVQQGWAQMERARQLREFTEAKDASGKPLYPHFEVVGKTMDALLRSGAYKTLPTAYQAALRHPDHASLYDQLVKQQAATQAAAKARAESEAAEKAKANRISARPRTPTGTAGSGGAKTLRDVVSDSVDEHS